MAGSTHPFYACYIYAKMPRMRKPELLPKKDGSLEERKNRRTAESKDGSWCRTKEWDGPSRPP